MNLRALAFATLLAACKPAAPTWTPLATVAPPDQATLVWVGRGECERFEEGAWVRRPELDYEFSVEQHRRPGHWSSVKSLRRRHPDYDGSAGPRAMTYFFEVDISRADARGHVAMNVTSSLGPGQGQADTEFRTSSLTLRAATSRFAPFDSYVITQRYDYERGELRELVELNDGAAPWVRNREVATLFRASTFDRAPTLATR